MPTNAPKPPAKRSVAQRLSDIAADLNERQKAFLLAAFDIDQEREASNTGFYSAPAHTWRWIEYGPNTEAAGDGPLRSVLRSLQEKSGTKLIDMGSGATLAVLYNNGLMESDLRPIPAYHLVYRRQVKSLYVKLTTDGRKVARLLRGLPMTKPSLPKPLTLLALRLIALGASAPRPRISVVYAVGGHRLYAGLPHDAGDHAWHGEARSDCW